MPKFTEAEEDYSSPEAEHPKYEVTLHAKGALRRALRSRVRREALRMGLIGFRIVSSAERKNERRDSGGRIGDPVPMATFHASEEQLKELREKISKYIEDGWVSLRRSK